MIRSRSRRDAGVELVGPGWRLGLDVLNEAERAAGGEGWSECEQLVEGQAQGVDIAASGVNGVVVGRIEVLGGHVAVRAGPVDGGRPVGLVRLSGDAEVGEEDPAFSIQEQVRRLDVAVDDPLPVGMGQGSGRLQAYQGDASEARGSIGHEGRDRLPAS